MGPRPPPQPRVHPVPRRHREPPPPTDPRGHRMTNIVVLSGGLDSTATLALAQQDDPDTVAITFDYGQRHVRETMAAARVAHALGVPHHIIVLHSLLSGSALLGDGDVPEGHYAAETMRATVVPGRNLLFAAVAVSYAHDGDRVWFGVHAGDHPIYPDCRIDFWMGLAGIVEDAYGVEVVTPRIEVTKAVVVERGVMLGAPLHLTWSCYQGGDVHCGRCGTCVERAEAFHLADLTDPTEYADPHYWREQVTS